MYVLVSMNATNRARADAKRIVNANAAAANPDVPPVMNVPLVVAAAVLPPAQVVIGPAALAQLLAACQPQLHAAGAVLPERAGSTRLKAFSSTDAVEWMSWKTNYLEVCEINAWPYIRRVREARKACQKKQPDTRPTSSLSMFQTWLQFHPSHCEVPGEVHAGRRGSVLPCGIQHCKTDFVRGCRRIACTSSRPLQPGVPRPRG
jgi:hypothetical protein